MRISGVAHALARALILAAGFCEIAAAQVNVTTFHNDNARTGQNTQETVLTLSNVNSTQFGKLFSVPVDGDMYAQPLYLSGVSTASGSHNIVYAVTEHDSVYAIDADNGAVYAQVSLIAPGGRTVNSSTDLACSDLVPEIGITSTPVIDPQSGTMYVLARSMVNGSAVQYLHALDVATLAEKFNGPVKISASVPGTAPDAVGGVVNFDPLWDNQRAALLLDQGHVVITWAGHCDSRNWHGWVLSYNAGTLAQDGVFNPSPNSNASGIWMGGGGPAADSAGNIYFPTGNGLWNGTTDWGDTLLKLSPPSNGAFSVLDYFTPFNQITLNSKDLDLSASGMVLLPPLVGSGTQLISQQGKAGTLYMVSANGPNGMGKYCPNLTPACTASDPNIAQEIIGASGGVWGSPAYWNGNIYWAGANEQISAYSFDTSTGRISTTPTSVSAQIFAYAAPPPAVSSNGNTNGILWALDGSGYDSSCSGTTHCLGLYAYDATNLANLLYTTMQVPARDAPGPGVKFVTPTIANGKVYVGSQTLLSVYGLLGTSGTPAAMPTFSPAAGTYSAPQSVTIMDATPGATIFYTTNGSTPTTASTVYSGPISVSSSETISAIATANGFSSSAVASAAYIITALPAAATPTFSLAAGTYTGTQSVTLSDATSGANIFYTTSGATPTTASTPYGGPITISASETIKAIATASGFSQSSVASAAYTINSTGGSVPIINDPTGFSSAAGFSLVGGATLAGTTFQLTDGGIVEARAVWYSTPVNVQNFSTDFSFQITPAIANIADGFTFTLQNAAAGVNAIGNAGGGLGYQGLSPSVAVKFDLFNGSGEGSDSTGFYVNGASPGVPAVDMTASGVSLHSGNVLHAHLNYDGTTLTLTLTDTVTNATFTTSTAINIPATVGAATAIAGFTAGTGGTSATQQILNWTYTAAAGTSPPPTPAATPSFSPGPGNYTGTQTVTISDATPGATIFYTTNGSTPTPSSPAYSGPIAVAASETVNAIATASGYSNSTVASASYSITPLSAAATPTFTPTAGSYTGAQSVSISDATPGATIYYTVNGATPTAASTPYSGAITVSATETIKAIAIASGFSNSAIASAAYTINALPMAATPSFSPVSGSYATAQSVTIGDATPGVTIFYTVNGSTPTTASTVYSGPISVPVSETLQAIAVASGFATSAVATASYTIGGTTTPVINDPSGFSSPGFSFVGGASLNGSALQLTDGGIVEARAVWFSTPVNVQSFTTDFTFQITPAIANIADGFTFTLQNATAGTSAVGMAGGGLGYQGLSPSVAVKFDLFNGSGEGSDSTGFYVNGAAPGTPAVDMTASGVNLHSGDVLHAHITYDGATLTLVLTDSVTNASFTTSQAINIPATVGSTTAFVGFTAGSGGTSSTQQILTWTYTSAGTAPPPPSTATPTFSPAAGSYTGTQSVTLTDVTPGASIFFTTNGTTPTTASTAYSGPIAVAASETIQAIAIASGFNNSAVASAAYTINAIPTAATPTFTPPAGSYTGAQSVTINDATPGAAIFYTLNGTAPSAGATPYSGPIEITASETVKAIATASGFTNSAVAAGAYTINAPSAAIPVFAPAPGSYTGSQSVTISDATAGASIFYTTNGTTPTAASTPYTGAITVTASETISAIAAASGYSNSGVASASYTINALPTAATPSFTPAPGSYAAAQSVTISDATPGATIFYTTNGATPTTASTIYGGAISVSATETIKAIAVASGYGNSTVASAGYAIGGASVPTINDPSGFASAAGLGFVGGASLTGSALQLTDGGIVEARAVWSTTPVNVQRFTTDFNFQITPASANIADGFTFTLQNATTGVQSIGTAGSGLGYQGMASSVAIKFDLFNSAGEGADSTGVYVNGATPTTPAVDMTASGVNLHSGDILHAHITYDGATLTLVLTDTVTKATFTTSKAIDIQGTVGAPTAFVGFTAGSGGYSSTQQILNWTYSSP